MNIVSEFMNFKGISFSVASGLLPLLLIGWLFSLLPWFKRSMPIEPHFFRDILRGAFLVFLGLSLFLQGVNLGLLPVGKALGSHLSQIWGGLALLPFGFIAGLALCAAEPSVRILSDEVERDTSGAIPAKFLIITLCIGVSFATALGMARLLYGWSFLSIAIPGYFLIVLLSRFCSPSFCAIAYDSSTVVTGPMVSSFLIAVTLGAAEAMDGRDPLLDGFGLVGIIAIIPVLVVMAVGSYYFTFWRKLQ